MSGTVRVEVIAFVPNYSVSSHAFAYVVTPTKTLCLLFPEDCTWTTVTANQTSISLGDAQTDRYLYVMPYDEDDQEIIQNFVGLKTSSSPNGFGAEFRWSNSSASIELLRSRDNTDWQPSFVYKTSIVMVEDYAFQAKNVVEYGTFLERNAPFVYSTNCTEESQDYSDATFSKPDYYFYDDSPCDWNVVIDYGNNHTFRIDPTELFKSELNTDYNYKRFVILPRENNNKEFVYPYIGYAVPYPWTSRDDMSHYEYQLTSAPRIDPRRSFNGDIDMYSFGFFLNLP